MSTDWMPSSRTGQLAMGRKWVQYITPQRMTQWNIPEQMITTLENVVEAAGNALQTAMTSDRTAVINTMVRVKFGEMVDHMRDLRRRHYFMPPLTEMDWVALEMRLPDTIITPIGPPTTVVQAEITYPHKNALALRIVPIDGQGDDPRPDWGYRIYFGVLPQKEVPEELMIERQYLRREPQRPEELTQSHFTRRKRDVLEFQYDNSGMKCFICIRYENGKGEVGPWGPMASAFIP